MVLVKMTIRNGHILNLDELIHQLQFIKEREETAQPNTGRASHDISLIFKPLFYGRHAPIETIWTIAGYTLKNADENPGLQNYDIFVEQNGALSHEQTFDDVLSE